MKFKRIVLPLSIATAAGLLLAGCSVGAAVNDAGSTSSETAITSTSTSSSESDATTTTTTSFTGDLSPDEVMAANADYTTVNDDEWSESDAVDVTLDRDTATSDSSGVTVDGSTVTITEAGVYRLSGTLNGSVVVAAPDDAQVVLILDGADIANSDGPAIEVQTADDVAISLAAGSTNSVSDAASYADDAGAKAAIHADTDLTISGTGSLTVAGNGNDGISSTDDLVTLSGDITVTAADDALRGKDALVVEGGTLNLTADGDGLKSDQDDDETTGYVLVTGGTIAIDSGDDAIQSATDTVITGGDFTLTAADHAVQGEQILSIGGGTIAIDASNEGMQAIYLAVFDGEIDITASDDGMNAAGLNAGGTDRESDTGERLEISGGTITIDAGKDGLDSNGTITVSAGSVTITSAANGGDGPLDGNGSVTIAEGTVTANGELVDPDEAGQTTGGPGMGGAPGEMPEGGFPGGDRPDTGEVPVPQNGDEQPNA